VSSFQIQFGGEEILTPGDRPDVLVAMNPAALKVHLPAVAPGGLVLVDDEAFAETHLRRAGYAANPLADDSLQGYGVVAVPMRRLTKEAVADCGLTNREAARCKNFFALGLVYWLFDRDPEPTRRWLERKFAARPELAQANRLALAAGLHVAEALELFPVVYRVGPAPAPPGRYRQITGADALALGLITAAAKAGRTLCYASYPITPASDLLHRLARYKNFGVVTFQAEDEIAAAGAAVGAAFGGALGACATSGPGLDLKSETLGLAVMAELPLVVIDAQRGGPSTGLPTKPEQSDLLHALFGRHGEAPLPVLAAATPGDGFAMAIAACRIALRYMTPVILLTDATLMNGAEPWPIPDPAAIPALDAPLHTDPATFLGPYQRDRSTLARPWVVPGTPALEHRIGGLEKEDVTGQVSYDPENHQRMVELRAEKVARVVAEVPPARLEEGAEGDDLLVVGWGSTLGTITEAARQARRRGRRVASLHLRYLHPLPANLGPLLGRFPRLLVAELNTGQLRWWLRARYGVEARGLNKVQGRPFQVAEVVAAIERELEAAP
jgi:2-oxoglutarate ferredoxin oxidoreductase subunit alpha